MAKIKYIAIALGLVILAACGSSSDDPQIQGDKTLSDGIQWTDFNPGLETAAADGKYMMVYFWRDG